jgi:hypothetical protein
MEYLRAALDDSVGNRLHVVAIHRLTDLGAVFTHVAKGTSKQGFDAEWRITNVFTVEGDLISRCEMFDEADIGAALARFDELNQQCLVENSATQTFARVADAFNRRDVKGVLALSSADGRYDDRRKGLRDVLQGPARRKAVDTMFETFPSSWRMEVEPIAIRGARLSLIDETYRDTDDGDRPTLVELLRVIEVNDSGLLHDTVSFDHDDMDAAFEELDARYLAGEAAAHAHTWSAITQGLATLNRGEIPATAPDFEDSDRRSGASLAPGDLMNYIRAALDDSVGNHVYIVVVHRLTNRGAVVTQLVKTTSREGLYAEWRMIDLFTVDGDLISRCEMFDEADLDDALARFDELES